MKCYNLYANKFPVSKGPCDGENTPYIGCVFLVSHIEVASKIFTNMEIKCYNLYANKFPVSKGPCEGENTPYIWCMFLFSHIEVGFTYVRSTFM